MHRCLLGLASLALAAVGAVSAAPAGAEAVKLAITDVPGLERLQTEWAPTQAALEQATGLAIEFFPVSSRTIAAEALRAARPSTS